MQHVQGLLWKPLDAAIGQLLAPYCLGGRQGDSKQNNDVICTHFAGRFDGHCDAAVLYLMLSLKQISLESLMQGLHSSESLGQVACVVRHGLLESTSVLVYCRNQH